MSAQTIVSPNGDRLIVLPEAEYLNLVDAADENLDREAVRAYRRRVETGEEEPLPSGLVDRILSGENPIRVWRQHRGLTIQAVADSAGITQAYLSQLETGQRRNPELNVMLAIAEALRVTIEDLT